MPDVAQAMLDLGCFLESLTGLHTSGTLPWCTTSRNFGELCRTVVHVKVPLDQGGRATISHIYPGANWYEREAYDLYGIQFRRPPQPAAHSAPR